MGAAFDYDQAFSRNVGWLTADEQRMMQGKRIVITVLNNIITVHDGGFFDKRRPVKLEKRPDRRHPKRQRPPYFRAAVCRCL